MQMIQRFMDGMRILTNEVVDMKDIGYETLWMDMDEVDENIIPNNIITALGNPIITWSVNYTDTNGVYYLYLAIDRKAINLEPFEVWFKNGTILTNPFDKQNLH